VWDEIFAQLTDQELAQLERTDLGVNQNFSQAVRLMAQARDIAGRLAANPAQAPQQVLANVGQYLGELMQARDEILNFDQASHRPSLMTRYGQLPPWTLHDEIWLPMNSDEALATPGQLPSLSKQPMYHV